MKTSPIFFCLLPFLLFSCGEQGVEEDEPQLGNPNAYSWSQAIRTPQTYSEEEMQVATRVCKAFQTKRAFVAGLNQDVIMDFSLNFERCGRANGAEQEVTARMRVDRTGQLELTNPSRNVGLLEDVLTDTHPRIKPFCDDVLAGRAPTNTIRDGLLQFQVTFFQASDYEWVQIAEFKERDGSYYPYLIERAAVSTSYGPLPENTHGFVKIRGVRRPCPDNNASSSQVQEWL